MRDRGGSGGNHWAQVRVTDSGGRFHNKDSFSGGFGGSAFDRDFARGRKGRGSIRRVARFLVMGVVGLLGVGFLGLLGDRLRRGRILNGTPASGPSGTATINTDQGALNEDSGGADVDKVATDFQRQGYAGLDNDVHPSIEMKLHAGFYRQVHPGFHVRVEGDVE